LIEHIVEVRRLNRATDEDPGQGGEVIDEEIIL